MNARVNLNLARLRGAADAGWQDEPRKGAGESGGGEWTGGSGGSAKPWDDKGNFKKSLGIERHDMPQIPGPVKEAFMDWAKTKGVKTERGTAKVTDLKPSQKHFNPQNAKQIPVGELKWPIMVSSDNYVLDGHNRWARMYGDDPKQSMNVLRVDLPAQKALDLMHAFPKAGPAKSLSDMGATRFTDADKEQIAKLSPEQQGVFTGRYADALRAKPIFDKSLTALSDAIGAKAELAPVKGVPRSIAKIAVDYGGNAAKIKDLVRGTVEVKNLEQATAAVEGIKKQFKLSATSQRNLLASDAVPAADGYRDAKFNVDLDDGTIAEIQINVPQMLAAKAKAHALYEEREAILRLGNSENRKLTQAESDRVDALNEEMKDHYDAAWKAFLSSSNLAADIGMPSARANVGSIARGGDTSQAAQARPDSGSIIDTGMPSTSKNSGGISFSYNSDEPIVSPKHREIHMVGLVKPLKSKAKKTAREGVLAFDCYAFDYSTVRSTNEDGLLFISGTHISKATVNEYLGAEIPDAKELGLEPTKMYRLLRDPQELAKGAATFNNLPVLNKHIAVNVWQVPKDAIIGSTGTDAVMNGDYLDNSMSIWDGPGITGINNNVQREISSAYRYKAVMRPGTYEGMPYDGVMTNIRGNHVAIVPKGRVGSDVVVGDSKPKTTGVFPMTEKLLSRKAILVAGALQGFLATRLANDAKPDFNKIIVGITAKNWKEQKPKLIAAVKPCMAQDADTEELSDLMDNMDDQEPTDQAEPPAKTSGSADEEGDMVDQLMDFLQKMCEKRGMAGDKRRFKMFGKSSSGSGDEPADFDGKPKPGGKMVEKKEHDQAMDSLRTELTTAQDAAIAKAVTEAETRTMAKLNGVAEAREAVRPWVGTLAAAFDSADAVYEASLKLLKVETKDVHPSAYKAILAAQPQPNVNVGGHLRIAVDAAPADTATKLVESFPGAERFLSKAA